MDGSLAQERWGAVLASVPSDVDEAALVRRAVYDPGAFEDLYRLHVSRIGTYLLRRTGDRQVADDLLSETFLAAWNGLGRYRDRGRPFVFWLYGIASRRVNRWIARRGRWPGPLETPDLLVDEVSRDDASEVDVERAHAALCSLPPKFQTVLTLHYIEDLSVADIGEVLGVRAGTVKSRLSRARTKLRDLLQARR